MYPSVLATTSLLVVIFLITFVLPRMSGVFQGLGSDLPLTTRLLLEGSAFLTHDWLVLLVVVVGLAVGLRAWFATPGGAEARDGLLLSLPAVGGVIKKATISRFARILGTLVYGGVPILEA